MNQNGLLFEVLPYIKKWGLRRTIAVVFASLSRKLDRDFDFAEIDRILDLDWASREEMRSKAIRDYMNAYQVRKLQIGAGFNTLEGWLNTDVGPSSKQIVFLDATKPFPFEDSSFDYVFCEHTIEHLTFAEGQFMLGECFRILRPKGIVRIATPSLDTYLSLYTADKSDIQEAYVRWIVDTFYPKIGVYNECFSINNAFYNWGHKFVYDHATLAMTLEKAGFVDVLWCALGESEHDALRGVESHGRIVRQETMDKFETMIVEARSES